MSLEETVLFTEDLLWSHSLHLVTPMTFQARLLVIQHLPAIGC